MEINNVGPPSYKLVYGRQEYYRYSWTINHGEIGVICTNLAIVNGGTHIEEGQNLVGGLEHFSIYWE